MAACWLWNITKPKAWVQGSVLSPISCGILRSNFEALESLFLQSKIRKQINASVVHKAVASEAQKTWVTVLGKL
jgi:hypothetical protein